MQKFLPHYRRNHHLVSVTPILFALNCSRQRYRSYGTIRILRLPNSVQKIFIQFDLSPRSAVALSLRKRNINDRKSERKRSLSNFSTRFVRDSRIVQEISSISDLLSRLEFLRAFSFIDPFTSDSIPSRRHQGRDFFAQQVDVPRDENERVKSNFHLLSLTRDESEAGGQM